jgi:Na+:H+ antiporter, NhaA family
MNELSTPTTSDPGTVIRPRAKMGLMIREFLDHEATAGVVLFSAAVAGLLLVNSSFAWLYDSLLTTPLVVQAGSVGIDKPLLLWINDGLMVVFFLLVGLEIKREVLEGELSSPAQIALPAIAAFGGMVGPAVIYAMLNWNDPVNLDGWAIPTATDIAFALGVLALLGPRVPASLKLFLLTLAIFDDLGAVMIIAFFYTADLSGASLMSAGFGIAALLVLNRCRVTSIAPYVLVGIVIWVFVLKSGVHATLVGVVLAMAIPMRSPGDPNHSPLTQLEHNLHPWVAFAILPIFAFANAGVSLAGLSIASLLAPLPLGIAAGLFFGKQLGIVGFVWMGVRLGVCKLPTDMTWVLVWGVSMLGGIGFTMSLFIGTLAFADPAQSSGVRLGVLGGSLLAAICGYFMLRLATAQLNAKAVEA